MIGEILSNKNELIYKILEGKIKGKRNQGRSRTSFFKQIISDVRLSNYTELRRFTKKRKKWRAYIRLQDQP
jgi:hypothetical protein